MEKDKSKSPKRQEYLEQSKGNARLPIPLELIPAEVSFENIGYFTPSSKRIQHITTKEKIVAERMSPDGTKVTLKVRILGTGEYGLPITSDLDYYRAFLKILEEVTAPDGSLPERISLPLKKLIRYAGKRVSGREVQEAKDWIRRGHYTGIQGFFYRADARDYVEIGGEPLFPTYLLRGQKISATEVAETNYVWLASWFRSNYLHHHLRPMDLAFHRRLRKPIAKSLYPLLALGWYAAGGGPYTKRYAELCQEFLLTRHRYLADIRKQLDPSHGELERQRFLKSWEYRPAARGHDWIITYYPGDKFLEDQHFRDAQRLQAVQSTALVPTRPQLTQLDSAEPLLTEILAVCGDTHNKAAYQKVIRQYPEGLLWMALSETRQTAREGRLRKQPGAYFMDTIKHLTRLRASQEDPGDD